MRTMEVLLSWCRASAWEEERAREVGGADGVQQHRRMDAPEVHT